MNRVISRTEFPGLELRGRGKVRDIYDLGDRLLIVATDRLSAFDVVLPTPIPDKGRVLTQLSLFWFEKLADIVAHHVIDAKNFAGDLAPYAAALDGRSMGAQDRSSAHRVRGARLHFRLRLEGLSKDRRHLRNSASRRAARVRSLARADLYALEQSHGGPRRKYFVR